MNQLQTGLAAALLAEDYRTAASIRDRLKALQEAEHGAVNIDWASLALPFWLTDRLERLGYHFTTEVQRRAVGAIMRGQDTVIQSETGSGKTLSFLAPMLARLLYPPDLYLEDLKGPQALVVVPTLELGVQHALLVFKMLGGNISQRKPDDPANIFTYQGPKGIKVRGLLNKQETAMARGTSYLKGVHVVVATPAALVDLYAGSDRVPVLDHLKVLVVDEYDECMRSAPEAMAFLMSSACLNAASAAKPQMVLVGATLTASHVSTATAAAWLKDPEWVRVGKDCGVPSGLLHRYAVCPSGQRLVAVTRLLRQDLEELGPDPMQPARAMVFASSGEEAASATIPLRDALWGDHQLAVLLPPGTQHPMAAHDALVARTDLAQDGDDVKAATSHELAQTSPYSASDPIRAMHSFRDSRSSLLVCGPQASRGLDLPAVSHVYNLGVPEDAAQYLHRAGRAGRIGSTAGGIVTTVVTEEELPRLLAICESLGLHPQQASVPSSAVADADMSAEALPESAVTKLRRGLEDLYNLQ